MNFKVFWIGVIGVMMFTVPAARASENAPDSWQGGLRTGGEEKTSPETPEPLKIFRPAQLPPGVIPAQTPVLFPRNQKVRVIPPPAAVRLAPKIVKTSPTVYPTPYKIVQPIVPLASKPAAEKSPSS